MITEKGPVGGWNMAWSKMLIENFHRKPGQIMIDEIKEEDGVDHPSHYGGKDNVYEVVKVCEAWERDFGLGHNLQSAIEYIARSPKKGSEIQDLQKAVWRIQREITKLRNG